MASGSGKESPFGPDGRSGAVGNQGGGAPLPGIQEQRGASPRQRHGSLRNPSSISAGGPALKIDPPGDRGGQVGTTADPRQRRPFRLGPEAASDVAGDDQGDGPGPVGDVPTADEEA